jgi:hypothetical protein
LRNSKRKEETTMKIWLKSIDWIRSGWLALAALWLMWLALPAAAVTDLGNLGGSGVWPSDGIGVIHRTINTARSGYNLTTSTQYNVMTIPPRTLILAVSVDVTSSEGDTLVMDVGDATDADGWLVDVNGNSTATHGVSTGVWGKQERFNVSVYDPDTAASQSAAAWGIDPSASVGGANYKGLPCPFNGWVTEINVYSNAAATSGPLTADATVGGTVTGLQAGLNSTDDTLTSRATQAAGLDAVTAGQLVGAKVTTDATWLPTTADVAVLVTVVTDEGATTSPVYGEGKYYPTGGQLILTPANDATRCVFEIKVVGLQM